MKPLPFYFVFFITTIAYSQKKTIDFLPDPRVQSNIRMNTQVLQSKAGQYQFNWLDSAITNSKVLLIGEAHWMKEIHSMIQEIILYSNTKDYFPLLVLEKPYSATAFINAYLDADSTEAERLFPYIKTFFESKENRQLLQTMKEWNSSHPDKKITVACSDAEHNFGYCLRYVFDPYFKACGADQLIPMVSKLKSITPELLAYMDSVITATTTTAAVSNMPFINHAYIQNVWDSFKESYEAGLAQDKYGYDAYLKLRLQRIYKNLTDDVFFGKQLRDGKAIIWGGSNHMRSQQLPEDSLQWEGQMLANQYPPTKGKVYAVKFTNFSYAIPQSYYAANTYEQQPMESFVNLVNSYKKEVPVYKANRFRVIDDLTDFSTALVKKSQANSHQPLYFFKSDMMYASGLQPALQKDAVWKDMQGYDAIVVLPGATLFEYEKK